MTPQEVEAHFVRSDGSYQFARWGRPIAPVIFGVEEESLQILKGAIEAVVALAGHKMTELDPELGANLMVFFVRDWGELAATPKLGQMIPDLGGLVDRLQGANANQYRLFRFDDEGAIQACFSFIRMDDALEAVPAETLALSQMTQTILSWSERAFTTVSPLAKTRDSEILVLRTEIGDLIRAAYNPLMPVSSNDASHALRLFARMQVTT